MLVIDASCLYAVAQDRPDGERVRARLALDHALDDLRLTRRAVWTSALPHPSVRAPRARAIAGRDVRRLGRALGATLLTLDERFARVSVLDRAIELP